MANRGDAISVDRLWDAFDAEREKACLKAQMALGMKNRWFPDWRQSNE